MLKDMTKVFRYKILIRRDEYAVIAFAIEGDPKRIYRNMWQLKEMDRILIICTRKILIC